MLQLRAVNSSMFDKGPRQSEHITRAGGRTLRAGTYCGRKGAADFLSYENEPNIENDSVGLDLDRQVNDRLNLNFDAHTSESRSQPDGELNDLLFLLQGSQNVAFDFSYGRRPFCRERR